MDSVRFGRILGKGARAAAKGLYEAVDAATAPNPNPSQAVPRQPPVPAQTPMQATVQTTTQSAAQPAAAYAVHKRSMSREAGRLGRSFLTPFARAGHVLWLEVMGTFFALFAAIFISYVYRYRAGLNTVDADAHRHLLFSAGAALVFVYFAVTSFMRARRREKR
jgi:hypothetical protein